MPFYLIRSEYIGTEERNADGQRMGKLQIMEIGIEPGWNPDKKEEIVDGWLQTNDGHSYWACGVYDTLEEARGAAHDMGYVIEMMICREGSPVPDLNPIEMWQTVESSKIHIDADEWYAGTDVNRLIAYFLGINSHTTDEQLQEIAQAENARALAPDNGIDLYGAVLYGTYDFLCGIRSALREEMA